MANERLLRGQKSEVIPTPSNFLGIPALLEAAPRDTASSAHWCHSIDAEADQWLSSPTGIFASARIQESDTESTSYSYPYRRLRVLGTVHCLRLSQRLPTGQTTGRCGAGIVQLSIDPPLTRTV